MVALRSLSRFITALTAFYDSVLWMRMTRFRKTVPTLRDGLGLPAPDPAPTLCVVIPAHNEQDIIARKNGQVTLR